MSIQIRRIPAEKLFKIAEALKTIGHPVRIEILEVLEAYPRLTVSDIQAKLTTQVEQSLLSHHLQKMKDKQILRCEKEGVFAYYSLKDRNILNLLTCMENCRL